MSSGPTGEVQASSGLNLQAKGDRRVSFDKQLVSGSAYDANASLDIGGARVLKYTRNLDPGDKDYFDEYLLKLHKQKHSLMIEEEHRELKRVDQSLLNMIRQIDHRNIGDLDALQDTPTIPSSNDYKMQRYLEQKEYEKRMLEMKLELREDQIRQLIDIIKTGGKLDPKIATSMSNSTPGDGHEFSQLKMEVEQLKRLSAKLNGEIQSRDTQIESLMKQSTMKDKSIDRLSLEIETIRKKGSDSSGEVQGLRDDIERLKTDARRIVAEREKLQAELEGNKRSMLAAKEDHGKELERLKNEYSLKIMGLENNQAMAGRSKDQETEGYKQEIGKLQGAVAELQSKDKRTEEGNRKVVSSLEQEVIQLKEKLHNANEKKVDQSVLDEKNKKEEELKKEILRLKKDLENAQTTTASSTQLSSLQNELMVAQNQNREYLFTISKLKQELTEKEISTQASAGAATETVNRDLAASKAQVHSLTQEISGLQKELADSKKQEVDLKVQLQQIQSTLTLANQKSADLEKKLAAASQGGDSATKSLQDEIASLKQQITMAESKKQTIITRCNEKIADKDLEIEALKSAAKNSSAGTPLSATHAIFQEKAMLEAENIRLRTDLQKTALNREELKALESGDPDDRVAKLKDIMKKKNDLIATKMDEIKVKLVKINELEAQIASGTGGGGAGGSSKELEDLRKENQMVSERMGEQMNSMIELADKVDRYEELLRKNKIKI